MSKTRVATILFGLGLAFAPACVAQGVSDEPEPELQANAITPSAPFYGDPAHGAVYALDVSMWEGPLAQREMDCFWDSGVRHIVAGTQVEEVTRQQLAMAVSRGMTVDAYVYLYWDKDIVAQVKEAFRRVSGFPIGRMWLDVEENPKGLGSSKLTEILKQGFDTCAAESGGTVACGMYTGGGFWKSYMSNTAEFASVPLWYARYDFRTSLDSWSTDKFGAFASPVAKQWAEQALCGVGVDKDTMQVSAKPSVVVDRTLPPDDGKTPPAPTGLYPADGSIVGVDYVKLMTATIPRATRYELALERWNGTSFVPYNTWANADPFLKTYPSFHGSVYRFRARAKNAYGFGPWSAWSTFDYGKYTGVRPGAAPPAPTTTPTDPAPATPPPPPPPGGDVPSGLSPDGTTLSSSSVTLSFAPVDGATRYEIAIENATSAGTFVPYVTYTTTAASKTYYPAIHKTTYRFRVRAQVSGTFSAWSSWASFSYE